VHVRIDDFHGAPQVNRLLSSVWMETDATMMRP
jgi:hypothetical protein